MKPRKEVDEFIYTLILHIECGQFKLIFMLKLSWTGLSKWIEPINNDKTHSNESLKCTEDD